MSEETIFREVDEELRRDRLHTAWRRYGLLVIGAAVAVVLVVAANEGWNWWQNSNAARSSDQFYAALNLEDGGDMAGAQKALDTVVAQGTGQYPELGKFKQAGLLAKSGKKDEALAAYDALASASGNQRLKELALLFGASLLVDKGDVGGVKSRVEGLLSPDDPLRNSAREVMGLTQYKADDLNGARDSFEAAINDPASSDEARGRLQLYVAQLEAQGAAPPPGEAQPAAAAPGSAAAPATGAAAAPPSSGTAALPSSGTAPAAANDNGAAGATAPAGVESNQPVTPDPSLELAVPAAPAAATAPAGSDAPLLSTGAGLPSANSDATAPAAAPATTPATAAPPASAPAATAPAATAPAPAATAPAPAASTAPPANAAPAAAAAPSAGSTTTAPAKPLLPLPATGSSGQ